MNNDFSKLKKLTMYYNEKNEDEFVGIPEYFTLEFEDDEKGTVVKTITKEVDGYMEKLGVVIEILTQKYAGKDLEEEGIIESSKISNDKEKISNFKIHGKKALIAVLTAGAVALCSFGVSKLIKTKNNSGNNTTQFYSQNVTNYDSQYDSTISADNLLEIGNKNMEDIANHMMNPKHNPKLIHEPKFIDYEKLFMDSNDSMYVKFFSGLRNDIVTLAYVDGDFDKVREKVNLANREIIHALQNNGSIQVVLADGSKMSITYDELSADAKRIVLELCWGIHMPLLDDTIVYNNVVYDQKSINEIILGKYSDLDKLMIK